MTSTKQSGFSLIELLLVVAIIGLLAAVAIPRYLGARDLARNVAEGDAQCRVMAMQLEAIKAESGLYPAAGGIWTQSGTTASPNPLPAYTPPTYTPLQWTLAVDASRLTYTITVRNTAKNKNILARDQNGNAVTFTP